MNFKFFILVLTFLFVKNCQENSAKIFEEKNGQLAGEAEDYSLQEKDEIRKWVRIDANYSGGVQPDIDENHSATASEGAYLEILPDTRTHHGEKLIAGENFSNQPGQLGILNYPIKINNPGRYYVWVRAFSTGSEDNGIHVGLDGSWPETGQRMQWCEGKNSWTWESKQRTKEVHCGVEQLIYLDIPHAGLHTLSFSMREDGFEFDKWMLTKAYEKPVDSSSKKKTP